MTETVDSTGVGTVATTVVTAVQLGADFVLPAWANQIVSIKPIVEIDVPTVAESVLTKFWIESDDIAGLAPFEVLGVPIGATLGATLSAFHDKPETFYVGAACKGGARIKAYVQALVANTGALTCSMEIRYSDQPPQFPQRHAKVGTLTATGAVASTAVPGTAYQIVGASRIVELNGVFGHTTVAAASAVTGYFQWTSAEFVTPTPIKMQMDPIPASVGALDITYTHLTRSPVDIPVKGTTVTLQDYLYMNLAPTVTANMCTGVIYE